MDPATLSRRRPAEASNARALGRTGATALPILTLLGAVLGFGLVVGTHAGPVHAQDDPFLSLSPALPTLFGPVLERGWPHALDPALESGRALREIERIAHHGAGAVAFDHIGLVSGRNSPFIAAAAADPAAERELLATLASRAHALGLRVVLRARLAALDGSPARELGVSEDRDWTKWFDGYVPFLREAARVARAIDADALVIGVGLSRTTHREDDWRSAIRAARAEYAGPLSYGADESDEIERIRFWDALDAVGCELFLELEREADSDPTPRPRPDAWSAADADSVVVHELQAELRPVVDRLEGVARRAQRPVWITGTGFRSVEESWRTSDAPLERFAPSNETDQRRAVAALHRALAGRTWLRGVLWWHWDLPDEDPQSTRRWARSFSARDKLAAREMAKAWKKAPLGADARRVEGRGGVVVSSDSTATRIGLAVLRDGGNAADAAVATALALAVALPEAGNLGGGGFAVTYDPRRRIARGLDFREQAPLQAYEEMYENFAREGVEDASTRGPLAAGIPGSVAGLHALWEAEGSLPWERLVRPAFELAIRGFVVGAATARTFSEEIETLRAFSSTRAALLVDGRAPREGERIVQPALAEVLRTLMVEGPTSFYRGAIARQLVEGVRESGGLWTLEDLAAYRVVWREPVKWPLTRDGRITLVTLGPPSSAGTVLPQTWSYMEDQRAEAFEPASTRRAQSWIESFRLAFADRNAHLADPRSMVISPRELVRPRYLRQRARLLPAPGDVGRSELIDPGWPSASRRESDDTTHLVVIDARGRAVSLTTTLNGLFGCGYLEPRTGILLNNQMDDFQTRPGKPNAYGLVGEGVNRVRPGARMLSSMSPSIVTRDEQTWLALGGRGGPRILSAVAQILWLRVIDDWPLERAVGAPRLHHQWKPDRVYFEEGRSWPALAGALSAIGYEVHEWRKSGKVHAAELVRPGLYVGVADPRERGLAGTVDEARSGDDSSTDRQRRIDQKDE